MTDRVISSFRGNDQMENDGKLALFAVISNHVRRSYDPRSRARTACRFTDVFAVGSAVIMAFDAESSGVRNSSGGLSSDTSNRLERYVQCRKNNTTEDTEKSRSRCSLHVLLRHADVRHNE